MFLEQALKASEHKYVGGKIPMLALRIPMHHCVLCETRKYVLYIHTYMTSHPVILLVGAGVTIPLWGPLNVPTNFTINNVAPVFD